jgi:ABC-type nitrate/sulfonate/bicarbonate transport system permease component
MSEAIFSGRNRLGVILLVPLAIIAVWALFSPGSKVPTPGAVLEEVCASWTSSAFLFGVLRSLQRVAAALVIAIVLSIPAAILAARASLVSGVVLRLVNGFRPIAPMAWIPIAILWFGSSDGSAIFIVGYAAFFPIFANLVDGIRSVNPRLLQAARTLGAGPMARAWRVLVPAVLPYFLVGVRIGLASGWGAIIAAELAIGARGDAYASAGIGQMMYIAIAYDINLDRIISLMLTVGIVALIFDVVLRGARDRLVFWYQGQ